MIRRSPIWPDPRVKPPFGAARINWGHPLAANLIRCWLLNERGGLPLDLAAARPPATLSGSTWGVGPDGIHILHDATTDRTLLEADDRTLPTGGNVTIAIRFRKTDATFLTSGLFGIINDRHGTHCPYSDGVVYWDYGGATEGTNRLSVGGLFSGSAATALHTFMFTTGPAGMAIWQDRIKQASNAANPTRTAVNEAWRLGVHTSAASDLYEYYFVYYYSRQLSDALIQWLSVEPYAFLQPVVRRRYSLPAAAGVVSPRLFGLLGVGT